MKAGCEASFLHNLSCTKFYKSNQTIPLHPLPPLSSISSSSSAISSEAYSSDGKAMTTSSGGSDEDLQRLMDQRKRNRMVSNRESARRSRLRKQKHLNELMTQLSQLREENNQVLAAISVTMQHYTNVEAENLVLRAQVTELSRRLDSLNQIEAFVSQPVDFGWGGTELVDEFVNNSLSCVYACNNMPILAATDMIPY